MLIVHLAKTLNKIIKQIKLIREYIIFTMSFYNPKKVKLFIKPKFQI